jgi:hypothetical protein
MKFKSNITSNIMRVSVYYKISVYVVQYVIKICIAFYNSFQYEENFNNM